MLPSHPQNAGENHGIETANKYSERVAYIKYLRKMGTNQNSDDRDLILVMLFTIHFGTSGLLIC
jgi:hypothetical protein